MTHREKGLFVGCGIAAWGVAVALAVIALIVAFIALNGRECAPMPATATVMVQADGEWQTSGLYVQRGQRVLLVAAGGWRHDGYEEKLYGPEGIGIHFDTAVLPEEKVGCLLARIGEGEAFAAGSSAVFEAERGGYLAFAMNDDKGTYGNNRGEVRVQVLVESR